MKGEIPPRYSVYPIRGMKVGECREVRWRCEESYRVVHHMAKRYGYKVVTRTRANRRGKKLILVFRIS